MAGIWSTRLMAALSTLFNVLALNLVLLVVSLPVITVPAAIGAASATLDRWRRDGEERVIREFLLALRAGAPLRSTVLLGVPLAAIGLGLAEAHHFARGSSPADRVSLGVCLAALLVALPSAGYVIELAGRSGRPGRSGPVDTWSLAARLAVRNLATTGPLFLIEIAAGAALAMIDPGLLLLGLPLLLLYLTKRTARLGLRRFDLAS